VPGCLLVLGTRTGSPETVWPPMAGSLEVLLACQSGAKAPDWVPRNTPDAVRAAAGPVAISLL
jgi:hypothetical protein